MRLALAFVLALGLAACHAPAARQASYADPVIIPLVHTVFMKDPGCTAVSIGKGLVLTARHCVEKLEVGAKTVIGVLVFKSTTRDYAIIRDPKRYHSPRPVIRAPRLGEHIYTVGYPLQLSSEKQELTITDGVVAGPKDKVGSIRITAPIYYGNSGGGVWGDDGALVGLSVSGYLTYPGMNFMVSAEDILAQR